MCVYKSPPPFLSLILTFGLISFILSACQTESSKTASSRFYLEKSESLIRLDLDTTTANVSRFLTYYDDGQNPSGYLFSVNTFTNQLQIYDLAKEQLIQSIQLDVNGERGVGQLESVHVIDFQNILLFPSQANNVYRIDTSGNKFEKISYQLPDGYGNALVSSSFFAAAPYAEERQLIVKTQYQGNYRSISKEALAKMHTAYSIDLNTGQTTMLPQFFPADYYEGGMRHFEFSATHDKEGSVYSFFGDHHLYYSSEPGDSLDKIPAASEYLKNQLDYFPANGDAAQRGKYYSASDHYGSILYDPYRDVYYRFCYPEVDITDFTELRNNAQFPQKFTIMILDRRLQIIGETLFDKNAELVPQNSFISKEGLYISVNHPESSLNREDQFSFRLLKLTNESKD